MTASLLSLVGKEEDAKSAGLSGESSLTCLSCARLHIGRKTKQNKVVAKQLTAGLRVIVGKCRGLNDTNIEKLLISRMLPADKNLTIVKQSTYNSDQEVDPGAWFRVLRHRQSHTAG